MNPFDYLKIGAGVLIGALLAYYPAYLSGKSIVRSEIEAKAAKDALARIQTLEKNNAAFKSLPDRDKCLVFMRDSGLSGSNCDR